MFLEFFIKCRKLICINVGNVLIGDGVLIVV